MTDRYVPPSLRKAQQAAKSFPGSQAEPQGSSSRRTLADLDQQTPKRNLYTQSEIIDHLGMGQNTLTDSPLQPGVLSTVMVFPGQHPDWPNKVLAKSNLHLVPGYQKAASSLDTLQQQEAFHKFSSAESEISIFVGNGKQYGKRNSFEYVGKYNIESVSFLKPRSRELVELLERKFADNGREKPSARKAEAWEETLNLDWVVIAFKKVEQLGENPMEGPSVTVGRRFEENRQANTETLAQSAKSSLDEWSVINKDECL
ncbi:MAG: hypothetical protein M1814_002342 [Vezdaea aestivalis]|nr:MAG: hypothetical protein M1814_002342 [Vezdaea aestivalis]